MAKKNADVTALRAEIATTKAEINAIASSDLDAADAATQLQAGLDQLDNAQAYDIDPVLTYFMRPGADVVSAELLLPDPRHDAQRFRAFMMVIFGPQIRSAFAARLAALYERDAPAAGIPLAERPARLAELRNRLHQLELDEEKAIVAAEARGESIDRREAARPEIIFHPDALAAE